MFGFGRSCTLYAAARLLLVTDVGWCSSTHGCFDLHAMMDGCMTDSKHAYMITEGESMSE